MREALSRVARTSSFADALSWFFLLFLPLVHLISSSKQRLAAAVDSDYLSGQTVFHFVMSNTRAVARKPGNSTCSLAT